VDSYLKHLRYGDQRMLNPYGIAIVLMLLLAAFSSDSWGQSKQTLGGKESPKPEQTSKTEQRGTNDPPLTVNAVPTPEQEEIAEKQAIETRRKIANDEKLVEYTSYQVWIGIATFFIFLLQLIAFSVQARYMRRTVTEMRKTTHATIRAARSTQKTANVAENNLLAILRPIIGINEIKLCDPNQSCAAQHISFDIRNKGTSGAFIDKIIVTISTSMPGALTLTETSPQKSNLDIRASLEPSETMQGAPVPLAALGEQEVSKIKSGNMALSVGFEIKSRDIQDNPRTQNLPYVFDYAKMSFTRAPLIHEKK
jgi:hypothetical protein